MEAFAPLGVGSPCSTREVLGDVGGHIQHVGQHDCHALRDAFSSRDNDDLEHRACQYQRLVVLRQDSDAGISLRFVVCNCDNGGRVDHNHFGKPYSS